MSADDQLRADASKASEAPATAGSETAQTGDAAPQAETGDKRTADGKATRATAVRDRSGEGKTGRTSSVTAGTKKPQRGTRRKKTGKIDNKPLKTASTEESLHAGEPDRSRVRKRERRQRVPAALQAAGQGSVPQAAGQGSGSGGARKAAVLRTIFSRLAGSRKGKSPTGKSPTGKEPQPASLPVARPASSPKDEGSLSSAHVGVRRVHLPLPLRHRGDAREDRAKGHRAGREPAPTPALSVGERCVAAKDWLLCHPRLCAIAAVLIVAAVALYSPVRNYYVATRTGQVLQVKYEQLSDENASLSYDVNRLQTKQGIEDEARRRGYVSTDEIGKDPNLPDASSIAETQPTATHKDPSAPRVYPDDRPWHVKALDRLFFYDPEATWNG